MTNHSIVLAVACAAGLTLTASAETVQLQAVQDNTLIQSVAGDTSNGSGDGIYAGRVGGLGGGSRRRAAIKFDVAAGVPAGASITNVTLRLFVVMANSLNEPMSMHRLNRDWGEGISASGGGSGDTAAPGDATWLHAFSPSDNWDVIGGDFTPAPSSTATIGEAGSTYAFAGSGLAADAQAMLDNPTDNHGWLILGNEAQAQTVKKFGSREHAEPFFHPVLVVTFDLPCDGDTDGSGTVDVDDLVRVILDWGTDGSANGGDVDGSGAVDVDDLVLVILNWGPC